MQYYEDTGNGFSNQNVQMESMLELRDNERRYFEGNKKELQT